LPVDENEEEDDGDGDDDALRVVNLLLKRRLPIEERVGTYFKNYVVKNGRMNLAYLHLTHPRLVHANFRASANG
jgi:hypothetical protein